MRPLGRPILGAFSGFFLGLFGAIDLLLFGTIKLDSVLITVLPIAGFVVGIVWGWWAPLGSHRRPDNPGGKASATPATNPAASPFDSVPPLTPPAEAAPPDTP